MALDRNLVGCQWFDESSSPREWECCSLGGRIDLEYGAALPEHARLPGPIPVYGSNGQVGTHSRALVAGPGILVGRKGSIGVVHRCAQDFWPIDTVYYVRRLQGDEWGYLAALLAYLDLARLNAATGVPGLSRRDALAIRGVFPPREEQQAIIRVLDAVDAAFERTQSSLNASRSVKRALVQQLFSTGIGQRQYQASELGPIPNTWKVVDIKRLLRCAQYGLSMPMLEAGRYPILRMAAIQEGDILLRDLKYVDLPDGVAAQYLLRRGDLLFNRTNSQELVGKVGVYRQDLPAVFASYLIRLHTDPALVDNCFLGQLLSSYAVQCRIKRYATPGVQQVNINASNLQRVRIAIPWGKDALKEQQEIAAILEHTDEQIRHFVNRLELLSQLKRGLMQDLLTGRVRITVPEQTAAAAKSSKKPHAIAATGGVR